MRLCVFCASSTHVDPIYFAEAKFLGELIARNNHQLVYGGANIGLMGELANTVKANNAYVIGVMPQKLVDKERAHRNLDEFITTDTMYERKKKMAELADAFIALPGGFGTFEELFEIMTLKQLGYHSKPIIIVNCNGFYDQLSKLIDLVIEKRFAPESFREIYQLVNSSEDVFNYL